MFSRSASVAAFAVLFSLAKSDTSSICYSYGVDYLDEGHYFIDSQSTERFSSVSYFRGCNEGTADVIIAAPDGYEPDEFICDQMSTTPENDLKTAVCPIQKNQMVSGHWLLTIFGNNGDGQPFAWQRDLYLTVGTPVTSTFTPMVTFSITSTPISTVTSTSIFADVSTIGPLSTVTLPSGNAKNTKTVTPQAVTTTSSKIVTRTKFSITTNFAVSTKTVTASCTKPGLPGRPDKPATYSPTLKHPAALVTPTTIPKIHRFVHKADRAVDVEWARARVEAAKQRRAAKANEAESPLERRAPDAPTVIVTASVPVNTTTTIIAPATTTTEIVLATTTTTSTLPPATVLLGLSTITLTLPTPTKTRVSLGWATTTKVITLGGTFTKVTTVTPTSSVSACKKAGGHFGPR